MIILRYFAALVYGKCFLGLGKAGGCARSLFGFFARLYFAVECLASVEAIEIEGGALLPAELFEAEGLHLNENIR